METVEDILASFNAHRPIILVDADEVLLKFVERLERYFLSQGYELRLESFQLSGNTYHKKSGNKAEPMKVRELIASFFEACVDDMAPVPGAADALASLSQHYQIAVLSNVPKACRARRAANLASLGIDYPVIANKGDKGPVVQLFNSYTNGHTVFIDDLPPQHASVADHCPESHRVHFIADQRLAGMIGKAPHASVRIDCWEKLGTHLMEQLEL